MMRKLMVDSVITWATAYKVDGFRFDLMGHHMLEDMKAVRAALDALTLRKDGVDGKSIYIYGEGWDFGEVANDARGINATQLNIGGTGIGVFNDRLRDGARGGNPFEDPREQGFITGLFTAPSDFPQGDSDQQKSNLLAYADWIRLGLVGNLSEYPIVRANGDLVPGRLVLYNGPAAAYTLDPQENVVYVSAHDNETIFDAIQLKAPADATLSDRIRMNNIAISLVMLSQGVPFFHAGDDILRSKSLDRNSYNSGDWFNKLDWTYESNNWGVGLPPEGRDRWDIFREFLQIRKGSPLFRLGTAEDVMDSVKFLNTGSEQLPGLIVMHLTNPDRLDKNYSEIVVLFNASPNEVTFRAPDLAGKEFNLHPIQSESADAVVRASAFDSDSGTFTVPGCTTAVFVLQKSQANQIALGLLGLVALLLGGLFFFFVRKRSN